MADILREAAATLRVAAQPRQFGFVCGHAYLDADALRPIRQVLETANPARDRQIRADYETRFAALVGDGRANSFASARMAFYALMRVLGIGRGDEVVLPAFTCAVMPNAVLRTGARPVYADIDPDTLGSCAQAIKRVLTARTRLIVAQHSFGIPCAIDAIVELARSRSIRLVEDCAIALDSSLRGTTVGNWGDAALFSTDHGKPLNTMTGGMLYTRHADISNKMSGFSRDLPALSGIHQWRLYQQVIAERWTGDPRKYPRIHFWTKMRLLFDRLIGANRTTFLDQDSGPGQPAAPGYPYPAALPPFLAQLGLLELQRWPQEKAGRKLALARLLSAAGQSGCDAKIPAAYRDPARDIAPLRFVFTLPRRRALLAELDNFVDTGAFWFMQPVIGAAAGPQSLGYAPGSCPIAEKTCASIVNLPCTTDPDHAHLLEYRLRNLGARGAEAGMSTP